MGPGHLKGGMDMKRLIAVMGLLLIAGASAYGQMVSSGTGSIAGGPQRGPGFGPPPEAFRACEGKSTGAAAQFTNPEGEIVAGTCEMREGTLVLRPDYPKGGKEGRHGPPPEAYKVCEGKTSGAVSQFTDPHGEVLKGICEEENGKMVLRPDSNKANRRGQSAAGTGSGQDAR